jgi:hypothetical protein
VSSVSDAERRRRDGGRCCWSLQLGKRPFAEVVDALRAMDLNALGGVDVLQSLYSLHTYESSFRTCLCPGLVARRVASRRVALGGTPC